MPFYYYFRLSSSDEGFFLVVVDLKGLFSILKFFPIVFLGAIILIFATIYYHKQSRQFKVKYLTELVKKNFANGTYILDGGLNIEEIYATGLVRRADRESTEDLIMGEFEGVCFKSSDVHLEDESSDDDGSSSYSTYFLGRFFEFSFPKQFIGQVIVTEEGAFISNLQKIKLESIEFNRKFRVYTDNEHTAFYILTPHLVEKIMELEKNNRGNIMMSFANDKLVLGINNNINTFEMRLWKKIDESAIKKMEEELNVIKEIVLELKLNTNVFRKGK